MRIIVAGALLASTFLLAGCSDSEEMKVSQQTEQQLAEANAQVPPPAIVNWNEKRFAKLIYELRDNPELQTYTYVKEMKGGFSLLCESVGYGLPYATQYTNPERFLQVTTGRWDKLAQPEPNGLYMPNSAEATWVICKDPKDGKPTVVYVEERTTITPYPLPERLIAKP